MKKFIKRLAKKSEGSTLVELIVVIAILGILAGVAVPAYSGYLTKAKDAAVITELDAVLTAAEAANATKGGVAKIVVSNSGKTVTITPATAGSWATTFESDFGIFMNNTTNSDTDLDGVIVSTTSFVNLEGTYASGATWRSTAQATTDSKPAGWSVN